VTAAPAFLVADIGATNARFCWADHASLCGDPVHLRTADFADSGSLLDRALSCLEPHVPAAVGLAIAGPVAAGRGRITNGVLSFDAAALSRRLGCPVTVVNDFHAVARALPELSRLVQIGGGAPLAGVKAVLGPGSGLGMGLLVPVAAGWQVLASEGGHGDLAPGNPLEAEILTVLQAAHGHVSWETVLSGPGLVRLYAAVCRLWGIEPAELSAEQITARGVHAEEPVCHQTLEIFFALLGAAAGNLALTVFARGGVYLAGGILPALPDFAAVSPLRRRFDERGAMSEMVQAIPLYLILDTAPGLTGALASLRDHVDGS
jgi:glucokinase